LRQSVQMKYEPRNTLVLALLVLSGCRPDEKAFYGRTFFCDTGRPQPGCGTTPEGAPMTCFGGRQLGSARDFCVEQCRGEGAVAAGDDTVCLPAKAKLKRCRPSQGSSSDPDGCGPDLACYRTDLLADEGVCLAIRVCSRDTDCADPALSTCASTVLKATFPNAPLETSNLQCVAADCQARRTSCPSGQSCLRDLVPSNYHVPDLCVPNCDANLNCPPNYACWRGLSGPAAPNICVPTLQSARCSSSFDCMIGECVDTGEGFKLCGIPCQQDQDCLPYFDPNNPMVCVAIRPGQPRYCVAATSFSGAPCLIDDHCAEGLRCYFSTPYEAGNFGQCRPPCGDQNQCPVRGGIAHTCFIRGAERSCYPGRFGLPCQRSEECIAGMTCQAVPPEQRFAGVDAGVPPAGDARICTVACQTDADCDANPWTTGSGYCEAGLCRLGDGRGGPCLRDHQCRGTYRCLPPAGGGPAVCGPA
jgi:hypothetical protein